MTPTVPKNPFDHYIAGSAKFQITGWLVLIVMSGQTREYNDRLGEFTEERFKEDFDASKYLREALPNKNL